MSSYLQYLDAIYSRRTFKRKRHYIRHNFGCYLGPAKKVLEIGPGMGEFITELARYGASTVDIIERDQSVLQNIAMRHPVRRAWNMELENIDDIAPELDHYDLIMCSQVLEHLCAESLSQVLRVLYAALAPGGTLIFVVTNGSNPFNLISLYNDITHKILFTEGSLRQLVAMAEIPASGIKITGYRIPPSTPLNLLRIVVQKVLHLLLLAILMANASDYSFLLHPNLCLVIRRLPD